MTRTRCHYCRSTATRSCRGYDLCEIHYAKVDAGRAEFAAEAARDMPPWRQLDRFHLVVVLEEMLGAAKVREILGETAWFQQLEAIRTRAKELWGGHT